MRRAGDINDHSCDVHAVVAAQGLGDRDSHAISSTGIVRLLRP